MNLCLVCRDVSAHAPSGLVRATCDLADALAEAGHSVHLLSDRSPLPPPDLTAASYEPVTVPLASGPFHGATFETARHNLLHAAAVYRAVKRIHEEEQPVDAVLAPLWRSEGAVCLLDERFPTVVSCMTSLRTLTEIDQSYRQFEDIEERQSLEREALARSPYLHGLTQAALSKTISDYQLEPLATAVIGRGIRDRRNAVPRDAHENPHRAAQILFVGRIERRKGLDTLLDALGELLEDGVEASLVIAGPIADPYFRARLDDGVAARPRLADAVRFTGVVPDEELRQLYSQAEIVCVPSRYESHGIVLTEAMMFGKAIVTSDAGGIAEVVEADRNALLSPPEDAKALARSLRRLLTDQRLRTKLGSEARATYERRFDARVAARQMESFLTDVIESHTSADSAPGEVAGRLRELLDDVIGGVNAGNAHLVAAELLDPAAGEPFRRLAAAARRVRRPNRPAATPTIAAVVLTRDRAGLLERTLDSLADPETPVETIVIDNASTPAEARRVSELCAGRGHVRLQHSDVNLGTAAGRQLGIELTDSDLVLFLDDDAELLPGALRHLVAELNDHRSVGAVTATVVSSDGTVLHSGGSLESTDCTATFGLIGHGTEFDLEALPQSGEAGWVPGTAVLVRRALLQEFPIDGQMAAYFEDNEWCYRIAVARPGSFRRSREALAFHQQVPSALPEATWGSLVRRAELLAAAAHFYQRHGVLLMPFVLGLVPEMRAADGTYDFGSIRILMELVAAKGPEWLVAAWTSGDLATLLEGHARTHHAESDLEGTRAALSRARAELEDTHAQLQGAQAELGDAHAELEQLRRAVAAQEETMEFLRLRHEILCMIEEGGWWRLRGRVLPLIRIAGAARRRLQGVDNGDSR